METWISPEEKEKLLTFKSYYVVWKPTSVRLRNIHTSGFKSYYVVWKLFEKPPVVKYTGWFKSYYVVWKHL